MKKRIVCFGDSNTWGYDPATGGRYDEDTRWTGRLQKLLGDGYQVIEEGQNGRTIAQADPWEWGTKRGLDYVLPMIESQLPFDLLIIMLGGNDLKRKFHLPAPDIAGSLQNMLIQVKPHLQYHFNSPDTKVLVVSPVHIGDGIAGSCFAPFFDGDAVAQSKALAGWFKLVAEQFGCDFFDAASVASPGTVDCLHMAPEGHEALAGALADKIREMLG